ncbi:MAG: PIG-L family deacetylase [Nostocoides sp.]
MTLLDGLHRIVVAHAHPDDESLSTGALLAELAHRGVEVHVVTATRGEQGGLLDGVAAPGPGSDAYAAHREQELADALVVLGVHHHAFLGAPPALAKGRRPRLYRDSGMRWVTPTVAGPSDETDARSFTAAPVDEAADDLATYVRSVGPDALLTYDADGGYGHPDHVRLHEVAVRTAHETGVPLLVLAGGRPPPDATWEWYDLAAHRPAVAAALSHHATQLRVDGADVVHQGGQREPIATRIGLRTA